MPRIARRISETAIYHVMMRGNNRQKIFQDADDKDKMVKIILEKTALDSAILYAFCIMSNHLHLVIKETKHPISNTMKRIGTSYAWHYNRKHGRIGHVFQDRFKSEPVESDRQFLSVIAYVHLNPAKAGIGSKDDYKWSSYRKYVEFGDGRNDGADEIKNTLLILSDNLAEAKEAFIRLHYEESKYDFIDIKEFSREDVNKLIDWFFKKEGIKKENLKDNRRICEALIIELSNRSELSLREIASILGLNREMVRKVMSKEPSL